jgi:hypothetical protein
MVAEARKGNVCENAQVTARFVRPIQDVRCPMRGKQILCVARPHVE